ncbi:MAG TPA: formimidoylglutamase [Solimonas sp.]|nr:formimidoylglutamase [Solimonas sp.]
MDIFNRTLTRATDTALFYSRQDASDPRMGEHVRRSFDDYGWAQIVIIGSPQDEGVRRNRGRPGASDAPAEIRRWLYRLTTNGVEDLRIVDIGDLVPQGTLEQTLSVQQQWVQQLLNDGKRVVVLGGGNDIAYADCSALARVAPRLLAINIDAHFDVREGPINSGTPYRMLMEEGFVPPANFYEIGYQPFLNSPRHLEYLRGKGVNTCSAAQFRELGGLTLLKRILKNRRDADAVFWGFDLDVVRVEEAPGVSAPNPTGLTGDELCQLATVAGAEPRTRIVEFSEVNPMFDIDGRTARLTAVAVHHYLTALAQGPEP